MAILVPASGNMPLLLSLYLPRALLGLVGSVAIGLTYTLLLQTRPSATASVFGILHLIAALLSRIAQHIGDTYQQTLISGAGAASDMASRMAVVYGAASLLSLTGWVFFIVALVVALKTRPPAEEAF